MKKTDSLLNRYRKMLFPALMFILLFACAFPANADGPRPTGISAAGAKTMTIGIGEEAMLHVTTKPYYADDDFLRWEIVSGKKYIRFEDNDYIQDGEDADIIGIKAGTAKVRCYISGKPAKKVTFTVKVKNKSSKTIAARESTTVYEEIYDDFDLEVKNFSSVQNLKWTIANTKIVRFDRYSSSQKTIKGVWEPQLFAVQLGTTTVRCTDTATGKYVDFTVHVVYDD